MKLYRIKIKDEKPTLVSFNVRTYGSDAYVAAACPESMFQTCFTKRGLDNSKVFFRTALKAIEAHLAACEDKLEKNLVDVALAIELLQSEEF